MDWIIALILLLAGISGLFLLLRRGMGPARKGVAGSFFTGLAEAHDPTAAMIALENEKRRNMEGEEDDGDPPLR